MLPVIQADITQEGEIRRGKIRLTVCPFNVYVTTVLAQR